MADLTAIVLTKNEEKNLPDCLQSLRGFASRVVVVDSGSADRTVEIARAHGADVLVHAFTSHARQFNWALENAKDVYKRQAMTWPFLTISPSLTMGCWLMQVPWLERANLERW